MLRNAFSFLATFSVVLLRDGIDVISSVKATEGDAIGDGNDSGDEMTVRVGGLAANGTVGGGECEEKTARRCRNAINSSHLGKTILLVSR